MHSPQSCPECGKEWNVNITISEDSFEFSDASAEPNGYIVSEKGVFVCEDCGHVVDKRPKALK